MKVPAVGCSLSSSSGAMDDGMTRKRRSHRACATSDEMRCYSRGICPRMKLRAATAGRLESCSRRQKAPADTRHLSIPGRRGLLRSPGAVSRAGGQATPIRSWACRVQMETTAIHIGASPDRLLLTQGKLFFDNSQRRNEFGVGGCLSL